MAAPSPFSFDFTARPALVDEALAILAELEVQNPEFVPVVIPSSTGRRIVFMYLTDLPQVRRVVDDLAPPP